MKRPLVIGVGNRLRGDDGAGPEVTRRLTDGPPIEADLAEATGEGAALIELWRGREHAIVIDAARAAGTPGKVFRLDAAEQVMPCDFFHYSTHAFGLAEAIEMSRELGILPRQFTVYAIEGERFEAGEKLSDSVEAAVERVTEHIQSALGSGH